MTGGLWKHQREAVAFALERDAAMWFMGMGTGKSRCAIEVARASEAGSVLVLAPKSVCAAWRQQFRQYDPAVETVVLDHGPVAKKKERASTVAWTAMKHGKSFAVIVNYESAYREPLASWMLQAQWGLVVLDESHKLKNPTGKISRFVTRLAKRGARRLALTGTPMPHSPLDVFAQFRALKPDIFGGSFLRFRDRYAVMGGYGGHEVQGFRRMAELTDKMGAITYKADRTVLDLPAVTHTRIPVRLSGEARRVYDDLQRDFVAQVQDGEVTAANALVKLLRLQQVTSGFINLDGNADPTTLHEGKGDALHELLAGLPADTPVVVFGRFTTDLAAVHVVAKRLGRRSLELSGQRRELLAWQKGRAPILAVQLQSGGTGIDLTRACYCVYLSMGFSLGDYEQSLARVHRPGQTKPVSYYHIITTATVDEYVYDALGERKNTVEAVLDRIRQLPPQRTK